MRTPKKRESATKTSKPTCEIVPVGKRRDGGTRYWCLKHKADATAKYGRPASVCRYAHVPPIEESETLNLDLSRYPGGVALWGAVPPVYDTTTLPLDRGIHVHARARGNGDKKLDQTFRLVRLVRAGREPLVINELDAIYFMVSSVLGFEMKYVECPTCAWPHLDKDWFSVHAHQRHLCAGCGRHFRDDRRAVGNPITKLREALGATTRPTKRATGELKLRQRDFLGGIQVWGSNPAIFWSQEKPEVEGIHVHAFRNDERAEDDDDIDDTFARVQIDGVRLDPHMVRVLMAQTALPHIEGRVQAIACASCGTPHADRNEHAFTPHVDHHCRKCDAEFRSTTRLKNTIGNPMVGVLERVAVHAVRSRRVHELGLLPETI